MSRLLEVDNLGKRFGGLAANEGISFGLDAGQIVGLIGPNGAGKTTLFNCVAGFFPPSEGSIRFLGEDVTGASAEQMARLGVARTFQIVRSFGSMTVTENVMVGAMLRTKRVAAARARALEALEFCALKARADDAAASLTVAEQRRLELARALASEPRLLLLDETMAGLTPAEVRDAVRLVKQIQSRGIACLVVEHVMEGIMPIADHMVVLDYGRKIAEGTPLEISRNPAVLAAYLGE
ncbi:MAG: ABC transporter ATP-binding protein [Candidatus Accumulibacter sp.]|jgi:branched-chain amino acid transport system ATP-binding protein|nr:ABC transporter ATP-binding protein [Accumulibacter sp.]